MVLGLTLAVSLLFGLREAPPGLIRDQSSTASPAKKHLQARRHGRININRATLEELKTLPGIGHATALRIVEYRAKNPPFRRVEELLIIRGISRQRLEKIRNHICAD